MKLFARLTGRLDADEQNARWRQLEAERDRQLAALREAGSEYPFTEWSIANPEQAELLGGAVGRPRLGPDLHPPR